jgi:hypothetical protein
MRSNINEKTSNISSSAHEQEAPSLGSAHPASCLTGSRVTAGREATNGGGVARHILDELLQSPAGGRVRKPFFQVNQ